MTQQDLADKAGLTRSHVSNIERCRYKTYKPELIEKIAHALGKTTKQVIDRIYEQDAETIRESRAKYSYEYEVEELLDDIKLSVRRIEKRIKGEKYGE